MPEESLLLDVQPDWKSIWRGMPEYNHADLTPWQTINVHFDSLESRQAFAALVGQTITDKTRAIWHPKAEIGRYADKRFHTIEEINPKYPVYIISKGRWESRLTAKALEAMRVPYRIVVEPQEYDKYAAVIPERKILRLPFSNLGQGSIPARNWVQGTFVGRRGQAPLDYRRQYRGLLSLRKEP